jgi:hypothetical protein
LPLSLTFDLLNRLPSLLASPEAWQGPVDYQLEVAAHISSLNVTGEFGKEITKAVLSAHAWASLTGILTQFGNDAVSAILEWIDAMSETSLSIPPAVLDLLSAQRHRLTEVISRKPFGARALRVACTFLDPRADRVQALGTRAWVMLAGSGVQLTSAKAELRSKAFALSIGLSRSGDGDVRLVREGFSAVYDAARDEQLDDEMWSFVEPYLPWYVVTWDRCVRLLRGVVGLFLARQWHPSEFLSTFMTTEQFQRAIEETDRTRAGSRYIKWMCDLPPGPETVNEVHAKILKRYCQTTQT